MKSTHKIFLSAALVAIAIFSADVQTEAAITFLNHFNDTSSYDINSANGDFAAGSGSATTAASPGFDTGFFPGSTPSNSALAIDADNEYVSYSPADNVHLASPTSGGITVGTWFKFNDEAKNGRLWVIGRPDFADDYLFADFGFGSTNKLRLQFRDGSSASTTTIQTSAISATSWFYVAATVDLTNSTMNLYLFDDTGALAGGAPLSTAIPVSGWNVDTSLSSKILVGHRTTSATTTLSLDEFSIDDEVLSQADVQQRVTSMVAGSQLVVPEPATSIMLLCASTLSAASLRRRSAR